MIIYTLDCPECGEIFEVSSDKVGEGKFTSQCPECEEDVTEENIIESQGLRFILFGPEGYETV